MRLSDSVVLDHLLVGHDQRTHHVVLLMLKDMAMPHIFARIGDAGESWARRHLEWHARQIELHDYGRAFAWIHANRLFETPLVGVRTVGRRQECWRDWLAWIGFGIGKILILVEDLPR